MSKVIAGAGAALVLWMLGAAVAVGPDERTVRITDKGFTPDRIEVKVGQKVTWENASLKDHTVTAVGKAPGRPEPGQEEKGKPLFDSGPIKPGAKWEHTFTREGTYEYACRMDKTMTGTLVVKPAKE
ncbi:MAG TPA: cupredoxin domain-containing protein [Planctomycetota bacterium]|nr:cupredoxin domain-containing protein [Planctomycetota bacterium]